jgi:CO/xanthine dehydrogenase Mo-binding subunit
LIERLVDAAARELNMSPTGIRRINLIPEKAIPYTSPTKLVFDSGEFEKIMDAAMEKRTGTTSKARQRESKKRGKLRGIGMATYTERCGGGFPETASIEFKDDRVDLVMGNQEYGTGLVTSYKQLVSDRLGIDADRIDVVYGDSDRSPRGLTGGSRALPVGGSALHEASLKIIDKGKQIAANLLEASAADIEYGDGEFRIVGTDRHVGLFDVAKAARDPAKLPPGMEPGLDTTQVQNPTAATFPNGCHIAEVEIDPDSGITTILRYTVVDDFGDVHQSDAARRPGARRRRAGHRPGAAGGNRLRRRRPATLRHVHGLRDAARRQSAVFLVHDAQRALHREPARHQGRGRSRRDRLTAGRDQRDRGRAASQRCAPHRHAGDPVARMGRAARCGVIGRQ